MKPGIHFTKIWFDDDMIELRIDVSDGVSSFSNKVYVGYATLSDAAVELERFKNHIHGGLLDIRFGEFGQEYANGAFHARLHFYKPSRLYISCKQQSQFEDFTATKVASEATLYLKTEPALLDNFIEEIKKLKERKSEEAYLEGI
jgi:hypothetical protein